MIIRTREQNISATTSFLGKGFPHVDEEEIEEVVTDHYDDIAERSVIEEFVPVLARRYAREDLQERTGERIKRGPQPS